jgi:hypothetical protein
LLVVPVEVERPPEQVDQRLDRHDPAGVQDEPGQQGPLLVRPESRSAPSRTACTGPRTAILTLSAV